MTDFSVVILVGGQSSRMGQDKRQLPWGNQSLLDAAIDIASTVTDDVILAASSTRDHALPQANENLKIVYDQIPKLGPLAGLHTGLSAVKHERCVAYACDMPFVNASVITRLVSLLGNHLAVIPRSEEMLEPLLGAWHVDLVPALEAYAAAGHRSLHGFFDDTRRPGAGSTTLFIPTAELLHLIDGSPSPFVNVNTPEEYNRALSLSQRSSTVRSSG